MDKKMKSGESYNLQTIFSGINDKIVIPDLQRDYCWGNADCDLVNKFLDTIICLDKSEKWPMGLIYGYTDSLSPEHIQLCDGQQRLTTLFLIVGVINRLLPGNKYQRMLISDFELENDDQEPYLQYAIRESSLYFLSDLVCHYFLNKEEINSVEQILEQPWYLRIYKQDPTVKSILKAVKLIEERLSQLNNLEELGNFITMNMEFLFYDMENRTNGEETFVVINTSGEPLSANQNLKPKIINEYKNQYPHIAEDWERMETWFWQHRNREEKFPHTSDEGMSEFLRCLMILKKYEANKDVVFSQESESFPYKDIDFGVMSRYFKAYQFIYTTDFSERYDKIPKYPYSQEYLFVFLPTLKYCYNYIDSINTDDVKRVYHLFSNLSRYVDLSRPEGSIANVLAMLNTMETKDILSLKDYSARWWDEEKKKLTLIANAGEKRNEMELLFAVGENNPIFNGKISILLQWSENNMEAFQHYLNRVNELWNGECDDNIDILRRALLTRNLKDYPLDMPNKSHLTLGWENKEWFRIIENNVDGIKAFLDDHQSLQEMIDNYSDINSSYYAIVKDAEILNKSQRKNIRKGWNNIVIVLEKERSNADFLIIFNGIYFPKNLMQNGWNYLWEYEGVLYTDHLKYNLTIDYIYNQDNGYKILIWSGKYKQKKTYTDLSNIQKLGLRYLEGKGDECWETDYIEDGNVAKSKLIEITNLII